MIEVLLGGKGGIALLDDGDAHLAQHCWSRHSGGYAVRGYAESPGRYRWVTMHREVLGLTDPRIHTDHINRNKLDNRRANLRVATNAQNAQNRSPNAGSTSAFRGVSLGANGYWDASGSTGTHRMWARFRSELDAARAAEAFRRQHMAFSTPERDLGPLPPCPCLTCDPARRELQEQAA